MGNQGKYQATAEMQGVDLFCYLNNKAECQRHIGTQAPVFLAHPVTKGFLNVCESVLPLHRNSASPNRQRINNSRHNKWSFLTLKFLEFPPARSVVHIYCPPHHSSIFNHFLPILFWYANCLWLKISPDTSRSASIWEGGLDLTQKPIYALHIECKEMSKIFFLCSVKTNFPLIC